MGPVGRRSGKSGYRARVRAVDLIVFDCDGVLVDSEAIVIAVEADMLTAAGFAITPDEIADRFVGLSYTTMMAELGAEYGRPIPDELASSVQQAALAQFHDRLKPVAGMEELLIGLDRPRCVASSSDLDRINLSLSVTGLDVHFPQDQIFSAQMVDRGKPAPDLFQLAAGKLGVEADACLVIEDSPAGVQAARAADMAVVGLVAGGHARPSLGDRLRQAGADQIFDTVDALDGYLSSL